MSGYLGHHYIIELYDCEFDLLDNLELINNALLECARIGQATILESKFHKFAPQGVSGVVVIAESHISIHTWPESNYAAIDFFTCKLDTEMDPFFTYFKQAFAPGDIDVRLIQRGMLDPAKRKDGHGDMERLRV